MRITYPDYYNKFKCSASDCKDTCCVGWEVAVDKISCGKYLKAEGDIGKRLSQEMKLSDDGTGVFIMKDSRCPFLNQTGLCDIYTQLGSDALCYTCKMFPRFIETFGASREIGIGLACPEAAKIILNRPLSEMAFNFETTDEPAQMNEIIPELYIMLLSVRQKLFELISNCRYSFDKRLMLMLRYASVIQGYIDNDDYQNASNASPYDFQSVAALAKPSEFINLLLSLECLNQNWRAMLLDKKEFNLDMKKSSLELKNIADYFIYRYLLKAAFDGELLSKVRLCAFACIFINGISDAADIADCARLFSKEVEYSDYNIDKVLKELKNFEMLRDCDEK